MANKDKSKIRCPVCGDSVSIEGNRVPEHNHKYTGAKVVCYGSFLPVFIDNAGQYQVGPVMYLTRQRQPWELVGDE